MKRATDYGSSIKTNGKSLLAREWGQRNEEILTESAPNHSIAPIPLPIRLCFVQNALLNPRF